MIKNILQLIIGIIGYNISDPKSEPPKIEDRIKFTIESIIKIFFKQFEKMLPLITTLITLVASFFRSTVNAEKVVNAIMQISILFGINP